MSKPTTDSSQHAPPLRLLFVEDDEDYQAIVRVLLGRLRDQHRFESVFLDRVATAQAHVDRSPVDIVVADYHLPDGTGGEVIEHARRVAPKSHRIVLTGTPHEADAALAAQERPHAIWDKSLHAGELAKRLEKLLASRGVADRAP